MSKRHIKHGGRFPAPALILPDDRLWLPGDPLRKRSASARNFMTEVERQCCCPGEGEPCTLYSDCFSVTCSTLSDIVITVTGAANDLCVNCTDFNGAFTASHVIFCSWLHSVSPISCDPRTGSAPVNGISATIRCSGGQCFLRGRISLLEDSSAGPGDWRELHTFSKLLPVGQVFQNGSNYDLTFAGTICEMWDSDLDDWFQTCDEGIEYECDLSGATFNVDFNAP